MEKLQFLRFFRNFRKNTKFKEKFWKNCQTNIASIYRTTWLLVRFGSVFKFALVNYDTYVRYPHCIVLFDPLPLWCCHCFVLIMPVGIVKLQYASQSPSTFPLPIPHQGRGTGGGGEGERNMHALFLNRIIVRSAQLRQFGIYTPNQVATNPQPRVPPKYKVTKNITKRGNSKQDPTIKLWKSYNREPDAKNELRNSYRKVTEKL